MKKNVHENLNLLHTKLTFGTGFSSFYAPNFEEVDWAYWFRVVHPSVRASVCLSVRSRTMYARVLKFHIWIPHGKPHGKIADPYFFSCPSHLPFWSYAPLKKSERNLMHAISYELCILGS